MRKNLFNLEKFIICLSKTKAILEKNSDIIYSGFQKQLTRFFEIIINTYEKHPVQISPSIAKVLSFLLIDPSCLEFVQIFIDFTPDFSSVVHNCSSSDKNNRGITDNLEILKIEKYDCNSSEIAVKTDKLEFELWEKLLSSEHHEKLKLEEQKELLAQICWKIQQNRIQSTQKLTLILNFALEKLNEERNFHLYRQCLLLMKMICIQNIAVIDESIDLVVQSILKCFRDGLDETISESASEIMIDIIQMANPYTSIYTVLMGINHHVTCRTNRGRELENCFIMLDHILVRCCPKYLQTQRDFIVELLINAYKNTNPNHTRAIICLIHFCICIDDDQFLKQMEPNIFQLVHHGCSIELFKQFVSEYRNISVAGNEI